MNVNFVLPEDKRAGRPRPTIFFGACLYLLAVVGLLTTGYLLYPLFWVLSKIAPGMSEAAYTYLAQTAYYALFVMLPISLYIKRVPDALDAMRAGPVLLGDALLSVLAALAGVMTSMYVGALWSMLIESLGGVIPPSGFKPPTTTNELMLSILFVGVMPGVCEELLFRGALLSAWEERGTKFALFMVSVLFTCLHTSIAGLPTEFMSGLIIGYIVISTGSIFTGMIYHTVYNAALSILSFRASQVEAAEQEALMSVYEQLGGAVGVISVAINLLIYAALTVLVLRAIKRRREKRGEFAFGISPPAKKRDLGWIELSVIIAGFITVGMLYIMDALEIAGLIT